MKRIVIAAALAVAGVVGVVAVPGAPVTARENPGVCQPQTDHLYPLNESTKSLTVDAPEGKLISGYCVKAGSINQDTDETELGPVYVDDLRASSVEISHPSGKDISHYIVFYVEVEVDEVTPEVPVGTPPTCEREGSVKVPDDTEDHTYGTETKDGVTTVTVTARPGVKLVGGDLGPWRFEIAQRTGEQCEPDAEVVVAKPPTVTPPTCSAPGELNVPEVDGLTYTTTELGGGAFQVTVAADDGFVLGEGPTGPWVFEAEQFQILDDETCDEPEVEEPSLRIVALSPVCLGDIPYIDYELALEGLDPTGKTATLTITDLDGNPVGTYADQPLSGRILYPGASADPADWPGWKFDEDNEMWVFDSTDARLRDGLRITAEVNPSATGRVAYPPASSACNGPELVDSEPPVPAAPTPPAAAPVAAAPVAAAPPQSTALPSTGTSSWLLALLATMLVLGGSGLVAVGQRRR
jgi:LPXTG-motif cell wall-anchored protein